MPGAAVDDGAGHLIQSGTTARIFTTAYPPTRTNEEDLAAQHSARVAAALEIDRAVRTYDFGEQPPVAYRAIMPNFDENNRTVFDGLEWVNNTPTRCK